MKNTGVATFLGRLRRDVRGNTLAMMGAFLIPLAAFTGSAVDVGRMYLVKIRLQQACDAGVLAGRRFMVESTSTTLDSNAITQARAFFASNFPSGIMGTPAYTNTTNPYPFIPTKTPENQVAGTATTQVPMTIMTMFGAPTQPLTVTCEATFDIADTDIMFVLDTTGSMACLPTEAAPCGQPVSTYQRPGGLGTGYFTVEKANSRLSGLRSAVVSFYDTMAANIDARTTVRYGFVPYSSTVNVGFELTGWLVGQAQYQSREIVGEAVVSSSGPTTFQEGNGPCMRRAGRDPEEGFNTDGLATETTVTWDRSQCTMTQKTVKPKWRYKPVTYNVSQYIGKGNVVDDPSKITGATSRWQGCIEERRTTAGATSFDTSSLPPDLDPDLRPSNDDTRWRPMWPDVTYYRKDKPEEDFTGTSTTPYSDFLPVTRVGFYYNNNENRYELRYPTNAGEAYTNITPWAATGWDLNVQGGYYACGKPVHRLAPLSRQQVADYVNATDFRAQGGTYHDVGMIWGTRLISPTGLFATDTAAHPGRKPPNRYIVFMTDGEMSPSRNSYTMYGIEDYDQRIGGGSTNLKELHNERFTTVCSAAKERGITVFVVSFGQVLNNELIACASQGQAYYARDNAALTAAFQTIAKQVALLRISK
ncbi:hypothetical protein SPDO_23040 [Sphingomonas dokdonensis]|uniref:Putative Flp pilus-assembly TadG-like N-terminal domain-containing protein n=1 Tax=Sphingomonas dokdonensis TaxID=344880 RepID=A0A245ZHU6_9SPHN|nr:hypothetical protein SPDO_23040 [Sphingomonas dokdonensis]